MTCGTLDNPTTCTSLIDCNKNRFGGASESPGTWSYSCVQCGCTALSNMTADGGTPLGNVPAKTASECCALLFEKQVDTMPDNKDITATFISDKKQCYFNQKYTSTRSVPGRSILSNKFTPNPPGGCGNCKCEAGGTEKGGSYYKTVDAKTVKECCTAISNAGADNADCATFTDGTCRLNKGAVADPSRSVPGRTFITLN